MTRKEFVKQYADRSGLTVKQVRELGYQAFPCDCGGESCKGWQMVHGPMKGEHGYNRWGNQKLRRRVKGLEEMIVALQNRVAALENRPQWTWTCPTWPNPGYPYTGDPPLNDTITICWDSTAGMAGPIGREGTG